MKYDEATLGQLVVEQPTRARVFEQRGLDYCCGGKVLLREACATHGLPLDEIAAELERVDAESLETTAVDPARLPRDPRELIRQIVETHHVYLKSEMPRISALAAKVTNAHGTRHPELTAVAAAYEELRAELEPHLLKEERVLFPWIERLATPGSAAGPATVAAPIQVMEADHELAGSLLAKLRELTGGYATPADGCPTFHAFYGALALLEADTHRHIHAENNLLFPLALELEASA